jgi:hypothetical protein
MPFASLFAELPGTPTDSQLLLILAFCAVMSLLISCIKWFIERRYP